MKALKEYDAQSIISKELIEEIFEEEDEIERSYMIADCSLRAKELGVISVFKKLVSDRTKIEKEIMKPTSRRNENFTEFIVPIEGRYKNMRSGQWVANGTGIVSYNIMGMEQRASYQPILPVERLENIETGEEQIVLAFYNDHKWKEIKVGKEVISSAAKIVSLSRFGLSVTSENAKYLVKYLNDVENLNKDEIEVLSSTTKLGWHGKEFIPYDSNIVFDGDSKFRQLFESIGSKGSEEEWISYVKKLRATGRPEIKFALASSFASVLVKPLGILPFFVDLWGETEGGKSVSLMLGASVWANPDGSQYIGDYKSTDVALEVRADVLNNLPVMLDDTSNATKKIVEDFENIVYRLCSGKGKSRSNKELGTNRENSWKNCFITNGERPLSSYVNQSGAINRIIEIECGEKIYQSPQETASFLKLNYGWAGRRFIEIIKDMPDLKEQYEKLCKELFRTDKMQKQAMSLSCIILADRIATEHIFKDNASISISDAIELLVDRDELSEGERCYKYLLDVIAMNSFRFESGNNTESWGMVEGGYAFIYPTVFARLCKQEGYSAKSFKTWSKKNGVSLFDDAGRYKAKFINGKTYRPVAILLDSENPDFMQVSDDDIPFS